VIELGLGAFAQMMENELRQLGFIPPEYDMTQLTFPIDKSLLTEEGKFLIGASVQLRNPDLDLDGSDSPDLLSDSSDRGSDYRKKMN
jgi:hypothetical protein